MTVRDCATQLHRVDQNKRQKWELPSSFSLALLVKEGVPMHTAIVPRIHGAFKDKLCRHLQRCRDAQLRSHYIIVIGLLNGHAAQHMAAILNVHRSTVYRVAQRFREQGEVGLFDRREDNGQLKLDEAYLDTLYRAVFHQPYDYGWRRPTWTRELLVETVVRQTGVRVHVATMSRALRQIGARRGRPRPVVRCPWKPAAKTRRLNRIRRLLDTLPANEVALYGDEVDIHLNPKVGWDWMLPGLQKQVPTPGQNDKRYLAGALDAHTGLVYWVEGKRKDSALFVALLAKLLDRYPEARVIHVVVDNCRVHTSKITMCALEQWRGRVVLHFLPPYCPNDNRIERTWEDLHARVTRNHRCPNMESLMRAVRYELHRRNARVARNRRRNTNRPLRRAA
jgi:transposase